MEQNICSAIFRPRTVFWMYILSFPASSGGTWLPGCSCGLWFSLGEMLWLFEFWFKFHWSEGCIVAFQLTWASCVQLVLFWLPWALLFSMLRRHCCLVTAWDLFPQNLLLFWDPSICPCILSYSCLVMDEMEFVSHFILVLLSCVSCLLFYVCVVQYILFMIHVIVWGIYYFCTIFRVYTNVLLLRTRFLYP